MQVWEDRAGGIYLVSVRDDRGKGRGSVSVRDSRDLGSERGLGSASMGG